jgi:hypothetical protein
MTINAWGDDIPYIAWDGENWVAIMPFCRALGIDEYKQRSRILKDPLFAGCVLKSTSDPPLREGQGQRRQALFLR